MQSSDVTSTNLTSFLIEAIAPPLPTRNSATSRRHKNEVETETLNAKTDQGTMDRLLRSAFYDALSPSTTLACKSHITGQA
jgi:hypothetical protein